MTVSVEGSNGPDTPLFGVNVGPSEIVIFLGLLSSVLTLIFHRDWGISAHIQSISAQALVILPVTLGFLRTAKHWIATHNNRQVVVAQTAAKAAVLVAQSQPPAAGPAVVNVTNASAPDQTSDPAPQVPDAPISPTDIPLDILGGSTGFQTQMPTGLPSAPQS